MKQFKKLLNSSTPQLLNSRTSLLEADTDIQYIQRLLVHARTKTMEIYTHVSTKHIGMIQSPLDQLDI